MNITKNNIAVFAKEETLSSYEFWKILNTIRKDRGASHVEHGKFLARVKDEIDDLPQSQTFRVEKSHREIDTYQLNKRQMLLIGMRESKAIRKQVLNWLDFLINKVNELEKQKADRADASLSFKERSAAVKLIRDLNGKETCNYHYSNEADLLNGVILGCSAKKYRVANDLDKTQSLRDTLTAVELEAFTALRKANETYLLDGLSYTERKEKLAARYKRFYCNRLTEEYEILNG